MHQYPGAHTHPRVEPHPRSLADLWHASPDAVGPPPDESADHPTARPKPYRDPVEWMLLKHVVQLALAGSVLLFVLYGGNAPLMALGYVATGLLLMGVVVLADRQRFHDRDPNFDIVEFVAPPPRPAPPPEPVVREGALVPLAQQMHSVLAAERVEVT